MTVVTKGMYRQVNNYQYKKYYLYIYIKMGFESYLAKQSKWDLFAITFGLLFTFIILIVSWSEVGGSKMIWILIGSAVGGLLAVGGGMYAKDKHHGRGGVTRPYGY
jgi:xanthine/uracil permease